MRTVEDYERIRKAYYVERLSMREICRQFHHGRNVIRKALERAEPEAYRLKEPRPAPVLAAYKPKIDVLIMESEQLPRKQRYTGRKIYQLAVAEHSRCLGREQDILDPLHYLGLLEQRPGAFEYAIPMRRWRKDWPANYARLLASLRQNKPDGDGIRERNNEDSVRFLLALAEQEINQRQQNVLQQRIKLARFPVLKELADFDFSYLPLLNKAQILDLARGEYIQQKQSLIFIGNPGLGKTHLSCAFGPPQVWSMNCFRRKMNTACIG